MKPRPVLLLALVACGNPSGIVPATVGGSTSSGGSSTGATSSTSGTSGTTATGTTSGATTSSTSGSSTSGMPLPPLALDAGCNPLLAGYDCFLPYPTDYFRVPDAGSPTGYWIETTGAAKLRLANGTSADISDGLPLNGYSHLPVVITVFPEAVSPAGFPTLLGDPALSVQPSSPMVLVNAATGQLIPSFVDLDPRATDPTRQAISLHPLDALGYQTRYVVGLHGVQSPDGGGLVAPPEGFRRLRDSQTAGDPVLGPLQSHFDQEVFPVLEDAGIPRSALQLAWDFTTSNEAQSDADMFRVRQLTMDWLASNTPIASVTIDSENAASNSWRQVQGVVTGPSFLVSQTPGSALYRDATGQVAQNGTQVFTFTANIPTTVENQWEPARIISYGHGFFGSQSEVTDGAAMQIAAALHAVVIAIDELGMTTPDAVLVGLNLATAPWEALATGERLHQAMSNWMTLQAALRGPLYSPLLGPGALQRPSTGPGQSVNAMGQSNAGQTIYDPQTIYYLGISQGAILGGTVAALSPDFTRIALNVGGSCFSQLMWRAAPFQDFIDELAAAIPDPLDQQKYTATLQSLFDRIDPATYAPYVLQTPLPQSPSRVVMQQNGLGDPEVPNLGSFLETRLLGDPQLAPNDFSIYGVTPEVAPLSGSGITLWDFGINLASVYALAEPASTTGDPVHDELRLEPTVLAQMDAFFQPEGVIVNTCADAGVCHATDAGLGFLPDGG